MEKRLTYTLVVIVIAAVLVLTVYKITGEAISGERGSCLDSDGGINYYVKGVATYENRDVQYTDACYSRTWGQTKWLKEYYCIDKVATKRYKCEKGCVDGACVK